MYSANEIIELLEYNRLTKEEFISALPYKVTDIPACMFTDQVQEAIDEAKKKNRVKL